MTFINIMEVMYPRGSVYISTNSTSPAQIIGGTWSNISDCFLLGAGSTYKAGQTGGEVNHTLTINEMPSHTHTWFGVNSTAGIVGQSGNYPIRMYEDTKSNWTGNGINNSGGGHLTTTCLHIMLFIYGEEQLNTFLFGGVN